MEFKMKWWVGFEKKDSRNKTQGASFLEISNYSFVVVCEENLSTYYFIDNL